MDALLDDAKGILEMCATELMGAQDLHNVMSDSDGMRRVVWLASECTKLAQKIEAEKDAPNG